MSQTTPLSQWSFLSPRASLLAEERGLSGDSSLHLLLSVLWTCICTHFSFASGFVKEMFLFLNQIVVSTSTVDPMLFCLLRVFLDSFFFLYLLPRPFYWLPLLSVFKYYYILKTSKTLWTPLSFYLQNKRWFIESSAALLHFFASFALLFLSILFKLPQRTIADC